MKGHIAGAPVGGAPNTAGRPGERAKMNYSDSIPRGVERTGDTSALATASGHSMWRKALVAILSAISLMAVTLVGAGAANANGPVPSTPENLQAGAGNAVIALQFTQPAQEGVTIAKWQFSTDGGTAWADFLPALPAGVGLKTAVLNNQSNGSQLVNGDTYNVTVRAVDSATPAQTSGASNVVQVTPQAPPPTPVPPTKAPEVSVEAFDQEALFSWVFDYTGGTVVNYEVKKSVPADSPWEDVELNTAYPWFGLDNGTEYTLSVRANVTSAGEDFVSPIGAASVVPGVVPDEPVITTVVRSAENTSVVVNFIQPGAATDLPITGYMYTLNGGQTWQAFNPQVTQSPGVITGISPTQPLGIQIKAMNIKGESAPSDLVQSNPASVPAPTNLQAGPGNGSAAVSFTAPTVEPLTLVGYQYEINGGEWVDAGITSPILVQGLTNGTPVTIALRTVATDGQSLYVSAASAGVTVTPVGNPTAPTNLGVLAGDRSGTITFTPPTDTGGSPVTNYEFSTDDGATWRAFSPAATGSPVTISRTSAANTELMNGTTYPVKLRAVTAAGIGAASAAVNLTPVAVPAAPTALALGGIMFDAPTDPTKSLPVTATAAVTFTPPANVPTGGFTVDNYQYSLDNGPWVAFDPKAAASPLMLEGLNVGASYNVRLRAVTDTGTFGAASAPLSVLVANVPSTPEELTSTPMNQGVKVEWRQLGSEPFDPPYWNAGSPVIGFEWTNAANPDAPFAEWYPFTPGVTASPGMISGLTNGQEYDNLVMRAVNAVGPSQWVAIPTFTPVPDAVLGAPTGLAATSEDGAALITFTAPVKDADVTIDNYEYQLDGGQWVPFNPVSTTSPVRITGLNNGQLYAVQLRAVGTRAGQPVIGAASEAVEVTPQGETPDAPVNLEATAGYTTAMVEFEFGPNTDPNDITDVEYSTDGGATWVSTGSTDLMVNIGGLPNGVPVNVQVRAVNASGAGAASEAVEVTPLGAVFVPINPERKYDSRVTGGPINSGQSRTVDLGGGEVPDDALAVAYNLTVTGNTGSGFLTVTPGDAASAGDSSTINWSSANTTRANAFQVGVDEAQQVKVFAQGGSTQFVLDVMGYYVAEDAAASTMTAITPERVYDSRIPGAGGPLTGGTSRTVDVASAGGVPADATAVAYTVTITGTTNSGYLAVAPAGDGEPAVSTINWTTSNTTLANSSIVGVNNGEIEAFVGGDSSKSTQFIIDVIGYFTEGDEGARFTAIDPARSYDSREQGGPLGAGGQRTTTMEVATVPAGVDAVAFNLTVTQTAGSGFLSVNPAGTTQPTVSTINWMSTNTTLANGSVVGVADTQVLEDAVTTFAGGTGASSTQYLTDVAGYYN